MICPPCIQAADVPLIQSITEDEAVAARRLMHTNCIGPGQCVCQHRVRPARPTEETTPNA